MGVIPKAARTPWDKLRTFEEALVELVGTAPAAETVPGLVAREWVGLL